MSPSRHSASWTVPRLAAHLVGAVATLAMAGWVFKIPALTTFFTRLTSMKAYAALGFMLLAGALHLAVTRRHTRIQAFLAGASVLLGGLTLFEYTTGQKPGIDQLVFKDPVFEPHPGRMSPISALNFVLLGIALLPFGRRGMEVLKEVLSLAVVTTSLFAMVGYLYGIPALYGVINYDWTPVAPHTGGSFMLLALGFLFLHRDGGLVRIFYGHSIAAMVARFLVPVTIMVPVLLGAIFMQERLSNGQLPLAMALSVISNVVLLVALIWYFCFMIARTEGEREALRQQAETDPLTGIYNRHYFESSLEHEVERTRRYHTPLSLIMFDIDWFKKLNDRLGHLAGDKALIRVARACERKLRSSDLFCRYGGEEFAIIAPETTASAAMQLARRIRQAVAAIRLDGNNDSLTISLGVAEWEQAFATREDFIAAADKALYRAKRSGRNRECLHGQQQQDEAASRAE